MTVIISLPHPNMIIMTADSRKSIRSTQVDVHTLLPIAAPQVEFTSMRKIFPVPGIGCVTLWGEVTRAESGFPEFLNRKVSQITNVTELKSLVEEYLREDLKAHEDGEDIGFHIGGFMPDGTAKLHHVFYGYDRPRSEGQSPDYRSNDHSDALALYNGRNDFVEPIVKLLADLQLQVGIEVFDVDPVQRIVLSDFVTRYISKFTPDVGGEIHTVFITQNNKLLYIRNSSGGIIPRDDLRESVDKVWG